MIPLKPTQAPNPTNHPLSPTNTAETKILDLGNGITLTLGGATLTVDNTPVYYGTAGLVVGTSTIPVPAPPGDTVETPSQGTNRSAALPTVTSSSSSSLETTGSASSVSMGSVVPFEGAVAPAAVMMSLLLFVFVVCLGMWVVGLEASVAWTW